MLITAVDTAEREQGLDRELLDRLLAAIARRLGMSPEAVRQRLSRGRERLRRLFEEEERAQ